MCAFEILKFRPHVRSKIFDDLEPEASKRTISREEYVEMILFFKDENSSKLSVGKRNGGSLCPTIGNGGHAFGALRSGMEVLFVL